MTQETAHWIGHQKVLEELQYLFRLCYFWFVFSTVYSVFLIIIIVVLTVRKKERAEFPAASSDEVLSVTPSPYSTTEAWRPWPGVPKELYAYYYCGITQISINSGQNRDGSIRFPSAISVPILIL